MSDGMIAERDGSVRLRVRVQPLASRIGIVASGDAGRTKLIVISGIDAATVTRLLLD